MKTCGTFIFAKSNGYLVLEPVARIRRRLFYPKMVPNPMRLLTTKKRGVATPIELHVFFRYLIVPASSQVNQINEMEEYLRRYRRKSFFDCKQTSQQNILNRICEGISFSHPEICYLNLPLILTVRSEIPNNPPSGMVACKNPSPQMAFKRMVAAACNSSISDAKKIL